MIEQDNPETVGGFSECEEANDDRPLRQGDVFEWLARPGPQDPWLQLGVIVTADCDIAYEKHNGLLSYVPIVPLPDYLRLFYLPRQIEKSLRRVSDELVALIRGLQAANLSEYPQPLSEDAIREWIITTDPEVLVADLGAESSHEAQSLRELAGDFRRGQSAMADRGFQTQFDILVQLRAKRGGTKESTEGRFWNEVTDFVGSMPGDCFFINGLSSRHLVGYVGYLRLVREINDQEIAIRETDFRRRGAVARRIARLTAPYLYRLTQQLIDVFAAIGLPTECETHRRLKVESLARVTTHKSQVTEDEVRDA